MLTDTERAAVQRRYRMARGRLAMTQTDTARATGIHRTTLSKIEAGRINPTQTQRKALARVLRVKMADLPTIRRAS